MLENFINRVKIDWWEVTHLGLVVGYFNFLADWIRYLTGNTNIRPNLFAYSEKDMDLDFDFDNDTDDPAFNREAELND